MKCAITGALSYSGATWQPHSSPRATTSLIYQGTGVPIAPSQPRHRRERSGRTACD